MNRAYQVTSLSDKPGLLIVTNVRRFMERSKVTLSQRGCHLRPKFSIFRLAGYFYLNIQLFEILI